VSVLSATTQKQVEDKLVSDGLITESKLREISTKAEKAGSPLFSTLVHDGTITNETLTKTIAAVTKVPYVNLLNAKIEQKTLELLPQEVAERYMAVPLGEMQRRLVVAMLDADNVQAVDFLANKIGRPLKVYAASEEGIRAILKQYEANSLRMQIWRR
jgi:type IV pilus assembly protein PilB